MTNKRFAAGEFLKRIGLKRMTGPMNRGYCLARAQQLQEKVDTGKLPPVLEAKARKQVLWYRWKAKQLAPRRATGKGEQRGRIAAAA